MRGGWMRKGVLNPECPKEVAVDNEAITGAKDVEAGEYATALHFLKDAASQRDAIAETWIGYIYETGGKGVPQDYSEALYWYQRAVADGETGYAQRAVERVQQALKN